MQHEMADYVEQLESGDSESQSEWAQNRGRGGRMPSIAVSLVDTERSNNHKHHGESHYDS